MKKHKPSTARRSNSRLPPCVKSAGTVSYTHLDVSKRQEQPQSEPVSTADPVIVCTRLTIDGRQLEVDSVDDHTQNVSRRDVTFEGGTGFPIFRKDSIDYVRAHMEQPDIARETTAPQTDEPPAVCLLYTSRCV